MSRSAPAGSRLRVLLAVEQLRRPVPGGIGTYTRGLLQGLAEASRPAPRTGTGPVEVGGGAADVAVTLYASRPAGRRGKGLDPLAAWGLPQRTSRLPGPLLTRAWDRALVTAPRGFDVVHAVSLAAPPLRWQEMGTTARVVTLHDLAWRTHPETTTARGRRWHEAAWQRVRRRTAGFAVPSVAVATAVVEAGVPGDRVTVMTPGSDHLPPPDGAGAAEVLARHGVFGPYVLTVSTLEPRKNLAQLSAAFAAARADFPEPWPLVVVGPPGWGVALAPAPGTVIVGPVPAPVLAGLYAAARLFVYVPLTEGYGLPPLEAMRCGVPTVVSTAVPSVTEAPAAVSRLVDPTRTDSIAEGLLEVAGDEALGRRLTQAGAALVAGRTWRSTAMEHVDLWRSL